MREQPRFKLKKYLAGTLLALVGILGGDLSDAFAKKSTRRSTSKVGRRIAVGLKPWDSFVPPQILSVTSSGSETQVNSSTANSQQNAAVAMDSSGNFVVVWESFGTDGDGFGIYGQRYNSDGTTAGSEFKVNTSTSGNQRFPDVAMDETGRFAVVWMDDTKDGSGWGVYSQRYLNTGATSGTEFRVDNTTAGHQRNPKVAMDKDGDFFVTWVEVALDGSSFTIRGKPYAFAGALASDFQVNTSAASYHGHPNLAKDINGNFVVAWQSLGLDGSGHGIYAQRFNSSSVAQGSEFKVNTTITGNQQEPAVAIDSTGNFVISWTSFGQDGSNGGIYAQRYLSNGTTNGTEFKVNTTTTGHQDNSAVTSTLTGDFTVVWNSYSQDSSFDGVFQQSYNSQGDTINSEVRVNTRTTDFQQFGSVAQYKSSNELVVAWQDGLRSSSSTNDGDDYGVFMQRYNIDFVQTLVADAGPDTSICAGDSVQIGGSPTGTGGTGTLTFAWLPSTGLSDAAIANPKASPATTTQYIVTVTDTASTTAKDTMVVTVHPNPVADAGSDQTFCIGDSVQIGGSPTANGGTAPFTFSWSPNTGLDDHTLANPKASPADTTTYIVTVTDANGCTDTDTVVVNPAPLPIADAGSDQTICPGDSVQIGGSPTGSGGTGALTFAWLPATGLSDATAANPKASPADTTEYVVTVTDINGCTDTDTVIVNILPLPIADAGSDQAICLGDSIQIGGSPTATGGTAPYTFSWTPATGLDDANAANPIASPADTTTYIVTVTDTNNKTDSDTVIVFVNPLPLAEAGPDTAICIGQSVQIGGSPTGTGGTGALTFAWLPTTGLDDATIANPTSTPSDTITYVVTVTDENGCLATDSIVVIPRPLPLADAGADKAICLGDSVQIGGSPTAAGGTTPFTFSWTPTTGLEEATVANPKASPADTTTYIVTVTDANNKTDKDTVVVFVNPLPLADAGPDTAICIGQSVLIGGSPTGSGGTGALTFAWLPTTGLDNAAIANPTSTPTDTITYVVTVTDENGCTATDSIVVVPRPLPLADAGSDQTICLGDSAQIGGSPTASGGTAPFTFSWTPSAGLDDASVANPKASPGDTTTYIVTITDANNKTDKDTVIVNVLPAPIVDAGPDKSITPGGSVQIGGSPTASGNTGPFTFSWSPAAGLSDATIANPVASPTNSTTYVVTVTGANNCSATDTVTITVAGPNKPFLFLATEFIQSKKHKLIEGNIHSNNDITIKKGKKSEIVGDLFAVDDIEISKKNDVIGNVTAGSDVDNDGDVSGVISEGALVGVVPLPLIPPFTVGPTSIEVPKKATLSLASGSYDNVEIEKGGILELSSGIYSMKSLELSKKTKLCIDVSGGAVTINISDDLVFGKSSEVVIKPNGEADTKLVTFNFIDDDDDNGDDDFVKIGKKSKVLGTIVAPDAWVILESKSSFKGAICAENIVVKSKVAALHHDAPTSLAKLAPEDLDDEDEDAIPLASTPNEFGLHQNFPNPFNPSTTIAFGMPKAGNVTLSIFNMRGQLVRTLVSDPMGAGNHKVVWDGNDRNGLRVASGVYVYRLEVKSPAAGTAFVATKKLILTK